MEARVIHLHIQKSGGTTMRGIVEKFFHQNETYPFRKAVKFNYLDRKLSGDNSIPVVTPCSLEEFPKINHEFVSGHFPIWFLEAKDPDFENSFLFTVFRDPVERVLSNMNYAAKSLRKTGILDESTILMPEEVQQNWMCKMLSSNPNLEGEALLSNAIENLKKFDMILFLDNAEEFMEGVNLLYYKLGIDFLLDQVLTLGKTNREVQEANIIGRIKALNFLDIALYEYARKNYKNSNKKYPQCFLALSEIMQEKSSIDFNCTMPFMGSGWNTRGAFNTRPFIDLKVVGDEGIIYFNLMQGFKYKLVFRSKIFPKQSLQVKVNDVLLETKKIDRELYAKFEVEIPDELIRNGLTKFSFSSKSLFKLKDLEISILSD